MRGSIVNLAHQRGIHGEYSREGVISRSKFSVAAAHHDCVRERKRQSWLDGGNRRRLLGE